MDETPVLLTDGGSSEEEAGTTRKEDLSADGVASNETGAEVLFLDLRGLDLNVLGLDVSLSEVVLDVSAVEGDDNLLGNLLSAVTGLLDGGLGALLDGLDLDFDIGEKISDAFENVTESIGDAIEEIPIGTLFTQILTGVISQLLGLDDLLGDSESESETSESSDSDESDDESEDGDDDESEE